MLNRLISFIQEVTAFFRNFLFNKIFFLLKNETDFMKTVSSIRFDMKIKMTDNGIDQMIKYPAVSFICLIDVHLSFYM